MALHEHEHVLLLEHLYGLLEEPEASRVRDLVNTDPTWREAFTEAQRTQALFGKAAQIEVTVPEFAVPGEQTPSTPSTAAVLASEAPTIRFTPPVRRRSWGRYVAVAVAACLLIGACGLTAAYQRSLYLQETQLSQIDVQLKAIDNQIAQLQVEQKDENARIPEQVANRFVHLNASGPAEYRPDAPLPVRVRTADARGRALPARVSAVLKVDNRELARREIQSDGDAVVELPAGLSIASAKAELLVEADTVKGTAKASELIGVGQAGYTTHLAVNKANLQTGEILFFRTLTLDRFSMKPAVKSVPLNYALVNAKGHTVSQLQGAAGEGGIGGGEISLANDLESGAYTLRVAGEKGEQLAERTLDISRPETPRLVMDRLRYRAGEQAKVDIEARDFKKGSLNLSSVENQRPAANGAPTPTVSAPSMSVPFNVDRDGKAAVQFRMPNIEGAALLQAEFENGLKRGMVEQLLPVVSSKLEVDFFPESGKLLAGVPNRVYFRVRTPFGEPVAPEGHVILLSSHDVVFDSERDQGMGVFTFTPKVGETYTLRVTSPQGTSETKQPFAGLIIERTGVAIHLPNAIAKEGEPINAVVHNTGYDQRLLLVASCRDRVVAEQFIDVPRGGTRLTLPMASGTRGVIKATLYAVENDHLQRLAERLAYRIPEQRLHLTAEQDKQAYRPGDHVELKMKVKDEKGQPAGAWLSAVVVDENELGTIEQAAACLESYFYLFAELGPPLGVEQTLLNFADGAETRTALDLYLGTRGWRGTDAIERIGIARADKAAGRDAARSETAAVVFSKENADRHQLAAELMVQTKRDLEARIAHKRVALEEERLLAERGYERAASSLAEIRNLPAWYANAVAAIVTVVAFFAGSLLLVAGLVLLLFRRRGTLAFACACACLLVCLVLYGTAGLLPHTESAVLQAAASPPWSDLAGEAPPKLFAWAGPEVPVGRFAAPAVMATAPTAPPEAAAHNMDAANRALKYLDLLARNERRGAGYGGQNVLAEAKNAQMAKSKELQKRFQENLAAQRSYGGAMAPTAQPLAKSDFANVQKQQDGNRQNAQAREYEHRAEKSADLQDTVLWKPFIAAPKGEAELSFDLSQRPTNYRVITYGNDASGRLGFDQHTLTVRPKE